MRQTEEELAGRIARALDARARGLDAGTLERLAAARKQALARYEAEPEPAWNWIPATSTGKAHGGDSRRNNLRLVLLAALVVSAIAVGLTWRSGSGNEIADIDAALLTDELPINAFIDQGFDSWLKRGSR